jgi:SAM-dependent methyltransferase
MRITCGPTKLEMLRELRRTQGLGYLAGFTARYLTLPLWRRLPGVARRRFRYDGRDYPYHLARYRVTWINERAVEIPIALAQLAAAPAARVLEVGNVLGHYVRSPHRVVDKYEAAPGVENLDVVDLPAEPRYDLVISVSTLEHVGWDETPREPEKAAAAIAHLMRCLAPGGRLFFTIPMGWNPPLDAALLANRPGLTRVDCLLRTGPLRWEQVGVETQRPRPYGTPFPCANAVLVGVHEAPAAAAPPAEGS